jgi:hypothetical protein
MEDVGIFYGHLCYFKAIWNTLWTFFVVLWNIFRRFGMLYQDKSGNPVVHPRHNSIRIHFLKKLAESTKPRFLHTAFFSLLLFGARIGVARWDISKPKIPVWVNFGVSCCGQCT